MLPETWNQISTFYCLYSLYLESVGFVVILDRQYLTTLDRSLQLYFCCILVLVSFLFALLTSHFISNFTNVHISHGNRTDTTKFGMGGGTEYKAVAYFVNW